ncbi:MAG: response regulator transcription factor [Chitinophagales bacterium]|nr:response regulator transcription factor [Chitinophagales bacterium]
MNVIIIEDEKHARKLIVNLLQEHCPNVNVIAECENLPDGVKAIRKHKPDLIFLDIEMPGHSGLELLDFFEEDEVKFGIIFTTAYNQYALQAFKMSAVDYLLKPLESEDLKIAVEKFTKQFEQGFLRYKTLKTNLNSDANQKIAIPTSNGYKVIELDKIILIKADSNYTEVFTSDDKTHLVSRTLKNFEETLPINSSLLRVHKSYIVNKNFITDIVKSDGGYILMNQKTQVPVSSDKMSYLIEELNIVKRK